MKKCGMARLGHQNKPIRRGKPDALICQKQTKPKRENKNKTIISKFENKCNQKKNEFRDESMKTD
jgi:hypothetical protein